MSANDENTAVAYVDSNDEFLKRLEIMQYINNDSNKLGNIISVVSNELGDKATREIIRAGVESYAEENWNTISRLHKQFKLSQLQNRRNTEKASKTDDNDNHDDYGLLQKEVFGITDVSCYIFQYLDLKSRLRCKNVNLTWLYNACNPASCYHLNLDDFIHYDHDEFENEFSRTEYINEDMYVQCEDELTKLIQQSNNNIRKLTLCQWPKTDNQLFSSMINNLTKIESIEIMQSYGDEFTINNRFYCLFDPKYPAVVENLLSINHESIKCIKIFSYQSGDVLSTMYSSMEEIFQRMRKLVFPQLLTVSIDFAITPEMLPTNIAQPQWRNQTNLKMVQKIF